MKPGWKSTEFIVTVCLQIVGLLLTFGVITPEQGDALTKAIPQIIGAFVMAASSFGYSLSRGKAKSGER